MPNENNEEVLMTGAEEERIYIIVPQTVDIMVDGVPQRVPMVPGRLMAQCSHVGRKLENEYLRQAIDDMRLMGDDIHSEHLKLAYRTVTTIVLSVRNSAELTKVGRELSKVDDILVQTYTGSNAKYAEFHDTNEPLYHTPNPILTAIAVGPVKKSNIVDAIGHLDLYE